MPLSRTKTKYLLKIVTFHQNPFLHFYLIPPKIKLLHKPDSEKILNYAQLGSSRDQQLPSNTEMGPKNIALFAL